MEWRKVGTIADVKPANGYVREVEIAFIEPVTIHPTQRVMFLIDPETGETQVFVDESEMSSDVTT